MYFDFQYYAKKNILVLVCQTGKVFWSMTQECGYYHLGLSSVVQYRTALFIARRPVAMIVRVDRFTPQRFTLADQIMPFPFNHHP